jgi:hypothetical protein
MKLILTAALLAATVAAPAFAQVTTSTTYYIAQDSATKKCTIVDKKPVEKTTVIVGDGTVYKTRTEAEGAMKTVKVCSSM